MKVKRPVMENSVVQEELYANQEGQFVAICYEFAVREQEEVIEILVPDVFIDTTRIGEICGAPWGGGAINDAGLEGDMVWASGGRVVKPSTVHVDKLVGLKGTSCPERVSGTDSGWATPDVSVEVLKCMKLSYGGKKLSCRDVGVVKNDRLVTPRECMKGGLQGTSETRYRGLGGLEWYGVGGGRKNVAQGRCRRKVGGQE